MFIRTFIAAAALGAAISAHAGLVGQPVQQYFTGDGVSGGFNAGIAPTVVGNQAELTSSQFTAQPRALFGNGVISFDWSDDLMTIEFESGDNGRMQNMSYALRLLDTNSRFTSLSTVFDNFGTYSTAGWALTVLDPATLLFEIHGLQTGSLQTSYSTSAQFAFTVETAALPGPGSNNVPEPASLALVGVALAGLAASRRRR